MKTQQSEINKWQLLYKIVLFFTTYLQVADASSQSVALKSGIPLNIPIDLTQLAGINNISNVIIRYSPELSNSELKLYPNLIDNYTQVQQLKEYQLLAASKNQAEVFYLGKHLLNERFKTTFFAEGQLKWKFLTNVSCMGSPVITNINNYSTIYVVSGNGYLYAINSNNTLQWRYQISNHVTHGMFSSPAIANDGTIYIGSFFDGYVYAININGTLKWRYLTNANIVQSSPAIANDGTVYVGSCQDGYLNAFNPDGNLKWKYKVAGWITIASPAIADEGVVYIGSYNYLHAIYPDGTLKWKYYIGGLDVYSSPAVANDGTVYIGSGSRYARGNFYAIYPNGNLKWQYQIGGTTGIYSSPAIATDGTIYFGTNDGCLYALTSEGNLKWKYYMGGAIYSSPAIAADGNIYIGSSVGYESSYGGYLYSFNNKGALNWQYFCGSTYFSSPAIANDGTIYFGSTYGYGYLNAISIKVFSSVSPWPQFIQNNLHNGVQPTPPQLKLFDMRYLILGGVPNLTGVMNIEAIVNQSIAYIKLNFSASMYNKSQETITKNITTITNNSFSTLTATNSITNTQSSSLTNSNQQTPTVTCTDSNTVTNSNTFNLNLIPLLRSMPVLTNNRLTIRNGKTLVITTKNFNASYPDGDYYDLLYKIIALRHGWFTYINNSKVEILSFSQRNIIDGLIQFNHDGSRFAPHYNVTVSSGTLTTPSVAAQVVFDPAPILINNLLIIGQGQSVALNSDMLKASYPDDYTTDFSLNFIISNLQHGYFESTIKPGISITNFTQRKLSEGKIKFTHDGSDFAPFCKVAIAGDSITTAPVSTNITFIRPPLITNNFLIINQGETLIINNNILRGSSEQTNNASDLIFTISEIKHGHFELITNSEAITTFSQKQINNGQILFVHDGTDTAPSYKVRVSDKNLISKEKKVAVRFNISSNNTVNIAAIVGGTLGGGLFSLAIVSIGLFFYNKRYFISTLERSKKTLTPLTSIESDAPIKNEQVFPVLIDQTNETNPALSQNLQLNPKQQSLQIDDNKPSQPKLDCVQTVINEQNIELTHRRSIFITNTPNDSPNNSGNPLSIKFSGSTYKQSAEGFSKDFGFSKKSIFLVEKIDEPITSEPVFTALIDQTNKTNFVLSQNLQLNQEQQSLSDYKANKTKSIKNVTQHRKTLSL